MKRILFAVGAIALATAFLTSTASHAQNLSRTPSPTTPTPSPSPSPIAIKAGRYSTLKPARSRKMFSYAIEKVVFVMKDGVTFKNDLSPKPAAEMEKK